MSNSEIGFGPPALAPLEIESLAEYVLGFPVHVAATLRVETPDASVGRLPCASCFKAVGAFGLVLTKEGDALPVVSVRPAAYFDARRRAGTFVLQSGETRRILIDLSEFFADTPGPGMYEAAIEYGPALKHSAIPPFRIRLRAPSHDEELQLDALRPEIEDSETWGMWMLARPADPGSLSLPAGKTDPLRFNRTMRYLLYSPRLDVDVFDILDGIYAPEAQALRAEVWQALGDTESLERQISYMKTRYPGLNWWTEEIAIGQGRIAFYRSQH